MVQLDRPEEAALLHLVCSSLPFDIQFLAWTCRGTVFTYQLNQEAFLVWGHDLTRVWTNRSTMHIILWHHQALSGSED